MQMQMQTSSCRGPKGWWHPLQPGLDSPCTLTAAGGAGSAADDAAPCAALRAAASQAVLVRMTGTAVTGVAGA